MIRTAILLTLALTSVASAGSVQTTAGKTLSGKIAFKDGNQVTLTPATGDSVTMPLNDISRLSMIHPPETPPAPKTADPAVPLPWQQKSIGPVKDPGNAKEEESAFTLRASGWGLFGGKDSFHFVYQPHTGDIDISAHITEVPSDDNPFVAGLSVRGSLEANADHASITIQPGGIPRVACRPAAPRKTSDAKQQSWLRLIRNGDAFIALTSRDGETWLPAGNIEIKMTGPVLLGLTCSATANQQLVTATFDTIKIRPADPLPTTGIGLVDGTVLPGAAREYDGKTFKYADAANTARTLPADAVANIFTRPLPADVRAALPGNKTGVLLHSGDIIDGEITRLGDGKFTVTSTIFGLQSPAYDQALSAVIRPVKRTRTPYTLITRTGAAYPCKAVTLTPTTVTIETSLLGSLSLKTEDVYSIAREP